MLISKNKTKLILERSAIGILKKLKQLLNLHSNNEPSYNIHSSKDEEKDALENKILTGKLQHDMQESKTVFNLFSDIVYREFEIGSKKGTLVFLDGLVNMELIDSGILKPLLNYDKNQLNPPRIQLLKQLLLEQLITTSHISHGQKMPEIIDHILSGDTVLLIDGMKQALFISLRGWDKRSVEEPATEAVVRGPREGFTESLRTNTSLLRRRLKTPKLKMELITLGRLSKTDIVLTYLEGIADDPLITEVRERLNRIDIDAILESGYIEELIQDNPYSIFPQLGYTERPDKVAGNLLEGHVGILIDNTPFCLIAPQTFFQMLQGSEDYYLRYPIASFIRWIRYLFLLIALLLPSLYIALTTYHQEMIPTNLLLSIAAARETVPFPAFIEALIMEISFEGLREAGVRLPRPAGQAVSIVGALVIGQAAVQAGIVSSSMVIIVALTGIASFVFPSYNLANSIRILRFPMMILAGTLGVYGILLGIIALQIHICRLRSFGVSYFSPVAPLNANGLKDVGIRAPWWAMTTRPGLGNNRRDKRMKDTLRPSPYRKNK
ncbi:spore germination protein [Priestia megaterium]|uniref:spore germination protein n=1 Tax=Priestia megaterium TaxID=1404 RepID=UPI001A9507CE|nr:spore germination protein [Priestia megaterium]QSX23345.1 spore germination protein [Priestia megaterium]